MSRESIGTWFFAMVVVRLGHRFLVVRERKHGQLWYLPAGRVEPGETFVQAAERETLEESGVHVEIEGVLRVEHTPTGTGTRMRVFMIARPRDDSPPKTVADEHSIEARWVTIDELKSLPLRGGEVAEIFNYVLRGSQIYPLALLAVENEPWPK